MEYVYDVSLWTSLLQEHGYELLGRLDSGSFSEVFAVRSIKSHRILAVKRMVARREITSDPRILKEIACLKQLSIRGACVIGLEGTIWKVDRLACLVLELAPMGDLERHVMEHWPLSAKLVSSSVRQVLSALTHCHRLRIAHRDVNPANVLLMSERSVRLADFGLAFHCRDPSSGRQVLCEDYLGRDSYLAPEVLLCAPYDALKADMWSMSSLCLFMLTGKHPLPPRSDEECDREDYVNKNFSLGTISSPHGPHSGGVKKSSLCVTDIHHNHRYSSHGSEGSCQSESDIEEPSPLSPTPDMRPVCACLQGSLDEDCSLCEDQGNLVHPYSSTSTEEEVFKPLTATENAVLNLVSRLRVQPSSERLTAEAALTLWKNTSS